MPKFTFKLQALLNVKLQMEDNLKNEMGKAVMKLESEKDILKQINAEIEHYIEEFNLQSGRGTTVVRLREFNDYISLLRERYEVQKENVNIAQDNVDKIREELIKAVQEREILEKLKERKYKEYLDEINKQEQKLIDEIVSYKHGSKATGEENG